MNFLQGQSATKTIIRLKDSTFTAPEKPGSSMWCGGFGSADWFHNYIQDMTFDVGNDNPSAIGLPFYSNNFGAVRNCRIVAGNNSGLIGLDLGHRDMSPPLSRSSILLTSMAESGLIQNGPSSCAALGYDQSIAARTETFSLKKSRLMISVSIQAKTCGLGSWMLKAKEHISRTTAETCGFRATRQNEAVRC